MSLLIQILGFACLGNLAADLNEQFEKLPMKPFKCSMCMGYWLSFIPFIWQFDLMGILYAAMTGIAAEILYRLIQRL
jgi:hypothetical protein